VRESDDGCKRKTGLESPVEALSLYWLFGGS